MKSENWKNPTVSLGEVEEYGKRIAYFYASKPLLLKNIKASCGCTKPTFDVNRGKLKVTYKAGGLPAHLEEQAITTHLTVTYGDDTTEKLYIILRKIKG